MKKISRLTVYWNSSFDPDEWKITDLTSDKDKYVFELVDGSMLTISKHNIRYFIIKEIN
jgi:hypothetical protein